MTDVARASLAEFIGTALLLAAVVGSGIMGAKLADGNDAVALLANALATGGALVALIAALGPVSGAHFNPAVTLLALLQGRTAPLRAAGYIAGQMTGALCGVVLAHAMFELPLLQESTHLRSSTGELIGEIVATFGLLLTIWGVTGAKSGAAPYAVAAYIVGAYWFTSSTSFANPAVTVARSFTDTFAGVAPVSVWGFIAAQLVAVLLFVPTAAALTPRNRPL